MPLTIPIEAFQIDKASPSALFQQLYHLMQKAINCGDFKANARVPSTRLLANELAISRSTVTAVYDQLIAEGYLQTEQGVGTKIAEFLMTNAAEETTEKPILKPLDSKRISTLGQSFIKKKRSHISYLQSTLAVSLPSRDCFPNVIWAKLLSKHAKKRLSNEAGYDHPTGLLSLKTALANYLKLARAVNTKADNVFIINSTQSALDVLSRAIINKGDIGWVENPGYTGARIAFRNSNAHIVGIPVDEEGIIINSKQLAPKLIYTTPSHQYPTGATMSYSRRMQLLSYAKQQGSWIIEDDYDSEFRYSGKPLPCLQGLDQDQQVIYLGTFSKSLSPSMRVAYMVVPEPLTNILKAMIADFGLGVNLAVQSALSEFIEQGHYSLHIRKTRQIYAEKQGLLLKAIKEHMGKDVSICDSNAGLQVTVYLKSKHNDVHLAELALKEGLNIRALSPLYQSEPIRQGLILGFAAMDNDDIEPAIIKLSQIMSGHLSLSIH